MTRLYKSIPQLQKVRRWVLTQRSRRELARLPAHLLNDIGVNEFERRHELSKPFWMS